MDHAINIDPRILGGTPVFKGTRVPVKNLFDYLEEGETVAEFLDDFPTVTMDQVQYVLQTAQRLIEDLTEQQHEDPA